MSIDTLGIISIEAANEEIVCKSKSVNPQNVLEYFLREFRIQYSYYIVIRQFSIHYIRDKEIHRQNDSLSFLEMRISF